MFRSVALCVWLTAAVAADSIRAAGPDPSTLPVMAGWVAARLGIEAPGGPPAIAVVPAWELARLRGSGTAADAGALADAASPDIVALYRDDVRSILVTPGWSPASLAGQSVLVHELVHHYQNLAGARFACPGERERDAYRLQDEWLNEHGTSLEAEFGIDALTVLARTYCGP